MSTEEQIKHCEFKLDTLLKYKMEQIDELVDTSIEIRKIKDKLSELTNELVDENQDSEPHPLEDK